MPGAIYFIGLGLCKRCITLEGLEIARSCDEVFFEPYTSIVPGLTPEYLSRLIGREVKVVSRKQLEDENGDVIIRPALEGKRVAVLVCGDPMAATTHVAVRVRAERLGIRTRVVYGQSIFSAAASACGLQHYRFGKAVTIVFPEPELGYFPETPYRVLVENLSNGLHTLFLLDIRFEEGRFMSVNEAIDILFELERRVGGNVLDKVIGVGLARIGSDDEVVCAGKLKALKKVDFGPPPHALIIPAKLHPMEEEALKVLARWVE